MVGGTSDKRLRRTNEASGHRQFPDAIVKIALDEIHTHSECDWQLSWSAVTRRARIISWQRLTGLINVTSPSTHSDLCPSLAVARNSSQVGMVFVAIGLSRRIFSHARQAPAGSTRQSLVTQRHDGVEAGSFQGRPEAKEQPDAHRDGKARRDGPERDRGR